VIIEDSVDIAVGLKALADEKGTVTWKQYQRRRKKAGRDDGI